MAEHEVNEVEAQTLKRTVDSLHQVLAVEGVLEVDVVLNSPEQLGRNDIGIALPAELLNGLSHDLFGLPAGVDLGVVEEVDTGFGSGLHALLGKTGVNGIAERDPRTERQFAHFEARAAQTVVLHLRVLTHAPSLGPRQGGCQPQKRGCWDAR